METQETKQVNKPTKEQLTKKREQYYKEFIEGTSGAVHVTVLMEHFKKEDLEKLPQLLFNPINNVVTKVVKKERKATTRTRELTTKQKELMSIFKIEGESLTKQEILARLNVSYENQRHVLSTIQQLKNRGNLKMNIAIVDNKVEYSYSLVNQSDNTHEQGK